MHVISGIYFNLKKIILKIWKRLWESFGSCLLNRTANPAQFGWKWAGLAIPKWHQGFFFLLFKNIFHLTKKIIPQNTFAHAFSQLISDQWLNSDMDISLEFWNGLKKVFSDYNVDSLLSIKILVFTKWFIF